MKIFLFAVIGFVVIWLLSSFVFFTFDYASISEGDRFGIVFFSIMGGSCGAILGGIMDIQ